MNMVEVFDAIAAKIGTLPGGILDCVAGYDTQVGGGTGFIAWSAADYAAQAARCRYAPLHIAQLPMGDPETSDYLDIESGAAGMGTLQAWAPVALRSFDTGVRPGQRHPAAYVEGSEVTPAVNALKAIGINSFPLILTMPMSQANAIKILAETGGPFPFVGVQYGFPGNYDVNMFSVPYLTTVSGPRTQWNEVKWTMQMPTISQAVPGPSPFYVENLQSLLNIKSIGGGAVVLACDGAFGPATTDRLKEYQGNHGLAQDGIAGPATWASLTSG